MKISVVMPVYNGEKYLAEAIQSILNQSEKDFELLIVNDGSTDDSLKISLSFNDERIRIINKNHSGLIDTLNLGLENAKGEYIARMDADDISESTRFEKQLGIMEGEHVSICGTWAKIIDENGKITGDLKYPPLNSNGIKFYSLRGNPFIHSSVMIKSEVLKKVGGYKHFFRHVEDYELWTRIIYKNKVANLPEPLLKYRIHSNQVTKNHNLEMRLKGLLVRLFGLSRLIFRF